MVQPNRSIWRVAYVMVAPSHRLYVEAAVGISIDHAVESFLAHRRAKRLAQNSLDRYAQACQRWQRWRGSRQLPSDLAAVDAAELRDFFSYLLYDHIPHSDNPRRHASLAPGLAPATVRSTRNVLRALWAFARGEGWLRADQVDYFRGDRIPQPIVEILDRPYWDDALVEALMQACEGRQMEEIARNRAIIVLIYESGMRLDELCRLEEDADFLLDQRAARIIGKGRKRRWIFWYDRADAALRAYRQLRRGPAGGPLFRATSTKNSGKAMSRDAIRALIKRLATKAGIELPAQAPIHAGRHGFAHAMIDGGAEISELAQLMGHSDVNTTYRYVRERRDRLQEIHRRAHDARKQHERERTQRLRRRADS